jgi:hypothetical protein
MQIVVARGERKDRLCSELLSFLGFIHSTPGARARWEAQ